MAMALPSPSRDDTYPVFVSPRQPTLTRGHRLLTVTVILTSAPLGDRIGLDDAHAVGDLGHLAAALKPSFYSGLKHLDGWGIGDIVVNPSGRFRTIERTVRNLARDDDVNHHLSMDITFGSRNASHGGLGHNDVALGLVILHYTIVIYKRKLIIYTLKKK